MKNSHHLSVGMPAAVSAGKVVRADSGVFRLSAGLLVLCICALTLGPVSAQLMIDYNNASPTETGFTGVNGMNGGSASVSLDGTSIGATSNVTFTLVPSSSANATRRDRDTTPPDSGAFTYSDLYRDFTYVANGGTITLNVTGLAASAPYQFRFFAYDHLTSAGDTVTTFTRTTSGVGDVTGSVTWQGGATFTDNFQFSTLMNVTSTASGTLAFTISSVDGPGPGTGTGNGLINGLIVIPEPSAGAYLALAMGGLLLLLRQRRTLTPKFPEPHRQLDGSR